MHRTMPIGLLGGIAGLALALAPGALAEQREHVAGGLIVKYEADASKQKRQRVARKAGVIERLRGVEGVRAQVVRIRGNPRAVARRLERSSAVAYAEPNFIYRTTATPNDPLFGDLYGLNNTGQTGGTPDADIDAPEGWDAFLLADFPPGGGAKLGIVDTGIQQNHEDLSGRVADCAGVNSFGIDLIIIFLLADPTIVNGKCNDDNGHGTHVAGTAAATADNATGVAGVAFNSPLAICKALNGRGAGTLEMVANCINWTTDQGADVISMSLGGPGSQTLQAAVRNATANGSLLVAAAGNSGDSTVSFPAGYEEVVSVAATDHNDQRASFSTFNDDVEVAAPGVDILSTWNDGAYNTISGTSMATPHASGTAALIAGANPGAGPDAWRATLDAAVDDLGPSGRDPQFGFGRLNLAKAAP